MPEEILKLIWSKKPGHYKNHPATLIYIRDSHSSYTGVSWVVPMASRPQEVLPLESIPYIIIMAHWLIKSEPEVYSWDQLVKDKQTRWDGIRNYAARLHLRAMKKGDELFFYHSNKGTEIVGIATVSKEAYPDPTSSDPAWFAIDVKPLKKLAKPVSLDQIKKEKKLAAMALVRISRLSVQPVSEEEWQIIMKMGGMETAK